jgi:uncharacterized protein YciI
MKFPAIIEYIADKAKIAEIRPLHRQYLTMLQEKGQLAASGPFTDDSGALIIYEANTREEAEALLKADPFNQNGVFVSYQIKPWKPVIFTPRLFEGV